MGMVPFPVALFLPCLCLCLFACPSPVFSTSSVKAGTLIKRTYVVHVAKSQMPSAFTHHSRWYDASLRSVSPSASRIYTYDTLVHGFSARLSNREARDLESLPGILAVLPEQRYELHTTRTPEFLGIGSGGSAASEFPYSGSSSDVVIGVLDTGCWPESKSFDDKGMDPVSSSWKGKCDAGTNFSLSSCNKKLIGARFFSSGYEAAMGPVDESKESKSPRDDDGHGTHTSSTAAGSIVEGASLKGYASGSARGMANWARVAVYKVCWLGGCFSSDILKAMETAVEDGVQILSLSLGGGISDLYRDNVAIGALAATEKGILVSCSAGNAGPNQFSLSNVAPWITTVGAGTLDRDFPAVATLGNGMNFTGVSLSSGSKLPSTLLPFVYAGNVSNSTSGNLCMMGTLLPEKVAGKIVLCDRGVNARVQKGLVVKQAGGVGMVLANSPTNGAELVADAHVLPATAVTEKSGDAIKSYLFSEENPTATISFGETKVGIQPSPVVAAFSSRGPNGLVPELLKPDLIAPGVNILAAWSGAVGPTGLSADTRRVEFNIISGTSMSCPHVSGLAGLLKAAHPDWSPAAIRSALMTTAYVTYKDGSPLLDLATGKASTAFDHGAGHVDPVSALNPGLVYDLAMDNYLEFLCALNYTPSQISLVARQNYTCDVSKKYSLYDLNYPSFSASIDTLAMGNQSSTLVKYSRTLTNVGPSGTYNAKATSGSSAVKVTVDPETITFASPYEKKSFTVTVTAGAMAAGSMAFGRLEWSDGKHVVGSPMAFIWS
ncbi:hypothetical protein MLD38_009275 [Melastoma candidum]|uniref:Uncharacterized protein n=1 Tax=Melastoma candidum TaxID=119954 RepID=A0ACB9RX77_9MYRT|nr:hypothetical protein MLD38_009275 [Melastoma candidum]